MNAPSFATTRRSVPGPSAPAGGGAAALPPRRSATEETAPPSSDSSEVASSGGAGLAFQSAKWKLPRRTASASSLRALSGQAGPSRSMALPRNTSEVSLVSDLSQSEHGDMMPNSIMGRPSFVASRGSTGERWGRPLRAAKARNRPPGLLTLPRSQSLESLSELEASELSASERVCGLDATNHSHSGLVLGFHSHIGLDQTVSEHDDGVGPGPLHRSMPDVENGLQWLREPKPSSGLRVDASEARSGGRFVEVEEWGLPMDDEGSAASSVGSLRSSFGQKLSRVRNTMRRRRRDTSDTNLTTLSNATRRSFRTPSYDFLSKDKGRDKGSVQGTAKWWHGVFFFSVIGLVACLVTLWAPYPIGARMPSEQVAQTPWSDGCIGVNTCICPRETICADDLISMVFLTIARASAWFDYPLYMLLFLSKARNVNNFLQKTMLRCWINFSDFHTKVHAVFGAIVGIEIMSHSFFHLLRWARRKDDIRLLWTHPTGITGLIALSIMPFVVLPMVVPYLKQKLSFEWRKGLHYLSIVWGGALMFHAPQRIFWLIGMPLLIYAADRIFGVLYKTHLVESAHFERLGDSSCLVTFKNPRGSRLGEQNSSYVYLMLPWLSKYQFHAFSVYPGKQKGHSQICISKAGDWTGELMKEITVPSHKPAFVVGPFLSPFCTPAMDRENLISVASGIGITPILSLIKTYLDTCRRINLVWICRDPGLVEWFLQNLEFSDQGFGLIYYTGKRSLVLEKDLPPNVLLYQGRPNLERTISGIITSIASGEGLPEGTSDGVKCLPNTKTPPHMRARVLLEKAMSIYAPENLFEFALEVTNAHNKELGLEPLVDDVDYHGVLMLMDQLLQDSLKSIRDVLKKNFELFSIDTLVNRHEFEDLLLSMLQELDDEEKDDATRRSSLTASRQRWMFEAKGASVGMLGSRHLLAPSNAATGVKSYLSGDGKYSAKNWSMLYCGGSEPVLKQLKQYKRNYGVGLSVEKFDW